MQQIGCAVQILDEVGLEKLSANKLLVEKLLAEFFGNFNGKIGEMLYFSFPFQIILQNKSHKDGLLCTIYLLIISAHLLTTYASRLEIIYDCQDVLLVFIVAALLVKL